MDRIYFSVNGVKCYVSSEISCDVTLLDYLRNYLELRGTKYNCREGGCGACIVSVIKSPGEAPVAVNSCLVSVTSCYNWEIITIEHLGNRHIGYNKIQTTLAEHNGSQCGYCTPGWIMAMYSLFENQKSLTMKEIEQSFASNICRCTGYRPILEAFKKFAIDSPNSKKISDIEDLHKCIKNGQSCTKKCCSEENEWCMVSKYDLPNILEIDLKDGKTWYRVSKINDIFDIWQKKGSKSYMLVAGNTAKGVVPISECPSLLIDISGVSELRGWEKDQNLVINGGTTLTELMEIFQKASEDDDFKYLKTYYDHMLLVAHIAVKNIATIAGNLMVKHQNNEFYSDIFLLLELAGAQITICQRFSLITITKTLTLKQFLNTDMKEKVILNVLLPPLNEEYKIVTYKIMPRAQNAHAVVNAGFLYRLRKSNNTVKQSRIVFGGLIPPSIRATATEKYLFGKNLFTNDTLQAAVKIMENELEAAENPPEPSAKYRKQLAVSLFYKSLLSICPKDLLNSRYQSGGIELHKTRPVSEGRQIFDTNTELWPLTQPFPKVEALKQCSAEVQYTEDLPSFPHEVFAAFVLSTEAKGSIASIDESEALSHPGVIAFYSAKDIPGLNSYTPSDSILYQANEEVLCSGVIEYFNQPIGIIVADSRYLADKAAKLVHVTYKNVTKPVIDFRETKKDTSRVTEYASIDATNKGTDVDKVIKGEHVIFGQFHFPMETMICVTRPSTDGLEVHCSTQWLNGTQTMISRALKIDMNCVDVYVTRVGGSYGLKISRSSQVAVACSLVAWKLNRPCRFIQSLTTNMRAVGKRLPCSNVFEVAVDKKGVIQHTDYKLYLDNGYKLNEELGSLGLGVYNNVYDKSRWSFKGYNVTTDTPKNTWCRSPGTLEAISMAEWLMERITYEQNLDPVQVRLANVDTDKYNDIIEMYNTIEALSDYKKRLSDVEKFNSENRWTKRALRPAFMRWEPTGGQQLICNLSVYHGDGTVSIVHSGIEMGQGINTKAIQIAAYTLKIPIEMIVVKGNNTVIGPNAFITGGSIASQNVGIAVERACNDLLDKLKPVRSEMPNGSWLQVIKKAFVSDIDLQGHGYVGFSDGQPYNVFGVAFAEVELDILTGQHEVKRVDMIEDVGQSINPEVDVGQIEGAFTMAMGYWTCEDIVSDQKTGEIMTDRTWNYFVPQAKDIPQDFRIHFRKKSYSTDLIHGSKAVGEPPSCLGGVIAFALRAAIAAARLEVGKSKTEWFDIHGPYTLEKKFLNSLTSTDHFKYN